MSRAPADRGEDDGMMSDAAVHMQLSSVWFICGLMMLMAPPCSQSARPRLVNGWFLGKTPELREASHAPGNASTEEMKGFTIRVTALGFRATGLGLGFGVMTAQNSFAQTRCTEAICTIYRPCLAFTS